MCGVGLPFPHPCQLEQENGVCGGGSGGRQAHMCWSGPNCTTTYSEQAEVATKSFANGNGHLQVHNGIGYCGSNRIEVQSMYSTQLFRTASAILKLTMSFQGGYQLRNSKTSQGGTARTYGRCPSPSISTAPCLPRGIGPKQSRSTLQTTRR